MQLVALAGSLAILAAYLANQRGWVGSFDRRYLAANALGSGVLAAVCVLEAQWGLLVLQVSWALISAASYRKH